MTQEPVNIAQAAHIYAFSKDGPRGNDGIGDEGLNTFENLLLTCHTCHKTIDDEQAAGSRYPVELLQAWKAEHEQRVELVAGINPSHQSHVVLYDRAIGGIHYPVSFDQAAKAMFPHRYPAEDVPIILANSGCDSTERDAEFWQTELKDLERKFRHRVADRLEAGEIKHLSVFAVAPMPLLIRLGTLLTEIRDVDVYQLHRNPKGWMWPEDAEPISLQVERPRQTDGKPCLVFAQASACFQFWNRLVVGNEDQAVGMIQVHGQLTKTVAFERLKPWAKQKLWNRQIVGGFDFGEPPLDEFCPLWTELVQFLGLGQLPLAPFKDIYVAHGKCIGSMHRRAGFWLLPPCPPTGITARLKARGVLGRRGQWRCRR